LDGAGSKRRACRDIQRRKERRREGEEERGIKGRNEERRQGE
jgi:hypothetical protein